MVSRWSPPPFSSSSWSKPSEGRYHSSSHPSAWAHSSSLSAPSSRPTHLLRATQRPLPALLRPLKPWLACSISTCASTRWDGVRAVLSCLTHCTSADFHPHQALFRGSTYLTSSPPAQGIMAWLLPALRSGYSVRRPCLPVSLLRTHLCSTIDFVVSKVTPDLISNLGYKVFFMFGTINIAGMGTFSLSVTFPTSI